MFLIQNTGVKNLHSSISFGKAIFKFLRIISRCVYVSYHKKSLHCNFLIHFFSQLCCSFFFFSFLTSLCYPTLNSPNIYSTNRTITASTAYMLGVTGVFHGAEHHMRPLMTEHYCLKIFWLDNRMVSGF